MRRSTAAAGAGCGWRAVWTKRSRTTIRSPTPKRSGWSWGNAWRRPWNSSRRGIERRWCCSTSKATRTARSPRCWAWRWGRCARRCSTPERAYPEIDYIFRPDQWGRGLASELAHELVRYAFEELGFEVLGASFDPHNHASMHVAAKAGFQFARTGLDEHGLPTLYYELRRPVRASGSDTARRLPPTA